MIRNKIYRNCSVGTSCMSIIRCLKISVRSCLHFECTKPKNPSKPKLKEVVFFQKLSHVITLLPFESHSASQFLVVGTPFNLKLQPEAVIGSQNLTLRRPIRSYTKTPKIIKVIAIFQEPLKFYVPQRWRVLLTGRVDKVQLRRQIWIPRAGFFLPNKFLVRPTTSLTYMTFFNIEC